MPKNFVGEPFSFSLNSSIENIFASESYVTILCLIFFCLTLPKNFIENPSVLCFRKLLVAKKFMDKKEGGVTIFSVDNFSSESAEKFRRRTHQSFINFGYRKGLNERVGGSVKIFRLKFLVSLPKNFVGEPFSLSLNSSIERIYASEGYVTIIRLIFFVSQCRKISYSNPSVLCFRKFPVAKKFMDKRGGSVKIFRQNFFVSQCRKVS